jgi:hypothetical protein
MRSMFRMSSVLVGLVTGCVASADLTAAPGADSAAEAGTVPVGPPAVGLAYYAITADARKCPPPMCGGWFLQALNLPMTKCLDAAATSCYVSALDWSAAGLTDRDQAVLLDAAGKRSPFGGVHAIVGGGFAPGEAHERGRFAITEGWVAESDTLATGAFVRVTDNGIRCVRAPCPSITEQTINTYASVDIVAMDFRHAGLTAEQIADCIDEMATPDGILVAGKRFTVYDGGATAWGRTVTAAYSLLGTK